METILKKYIPLDWLAMYQISASGSFTATTNKSLPFNWEELYQTIAPYDNYRETIFELAPGTALLYNEFRDPFNEIDNFCLEYTKKHTDTVDYLTMPAIQTSQKRVHFGFYNTDEKNLFTPVDKAFIEQLSPILISASNIMTLYEQFDFQKVTFDNLIKAQNCKYIILDSDLKTIDFPIKTLNFFNEVFADKNLNDLPKQISSYIDKTLSGIRFTLRQEPTTCKLNLKNGTLIIYTYQIEKYFLMKFIFQKHDIFNEKTLPLTNMESTVLKLLRSGFIVKEIADQLNLSDRGVNFHKYNIVQKLRVSNIVEAISVLADYGI